MEYRRFLSYLYLYEHHRKMNCIGFVKAEQRAEEIRLTIQIEEERRMDGRKLSICFYKPDAGKEGNFKKYILDEIVLEWKKTEFYRNYPISTLPEDFRLEDQHGILLLSQDHLYYGSVWKGNEIPLELFEKVDQNDNRKNTVEDDAVEVTAPNTDKDAAREKESSAESEKNVTKEEETVDSAIKAEKEDNAEKEAVELEISRRESKDSNIESRDEIFGSEDKISERKEEIPEPEHKMVESKDKISGLKNEISEQENPMMESEISSQSMKEDIPVFQEGNRISIQQLRSRNGEKNRYSNNPFLLQAYQKYGHILEAKIRYHGKDCDCIGVPGIYGNREKYMAEMYRFPIFLCMSDHKTKTGEFGYWIHMIQ